jgi:hypothetical protein
MSSRERTISPIENIVSTPSHNQGVQLDSTEQREVSSDPVDVNSLPSPTTSYTSTDNGRPLPGYHERIGIEETSGIAEPGENHPFLHENHTHATSTEQTKTKAKGNTVKLLKTWWLEVVSLIIAVSALIAIVATVAKYNNKQQPAWKYAINLNTLVAILSTLMRACMVAVAEEGESNRTLSHCWLTPSSHQPAEMDVVSPTKATTIPSSLRCSFSWSMGLNATPFPDKNIV